MAGIRVFADAGGATKPHPVRKSPSMIEKVLTSAVPREFHAFQLRGIALPVVFVGAVEAVRAAAFPDALDGLPALAFFFGVLTVGAVVFSTVVFRTIGRLHERLSGQSKRLAAINRIASASAEGTDLARLLDTAIEQVLEILSADAGLICVVDLERGEHTALASRGFSDEVTRDFYRKPLVDDPIAMKVVATGQPVAVACLLDDPTFGDLARREGVRSSISVPLKLGGEVAGVLAIATREERHFADSEREFLLNVASQLALAVKHAAAFERALRRTRELEALVAVGGAATSSLKLADVLDRALDAVLDVTDADAGEIWLCEGPALVLARQRGPELGAYHEAQRLTTGESLPATVARTRESLLVREPDRGVPRGGAPTSRFEAYQALALVHRDELQGVLGVAAHARDGLAEADALRLMAGVAEVVSVAIDNARLYERVQDAAVVDERERLAREMHDGLAQVLTYVNAQTITIRKLVGSGRTMDATEEIERMQVAVRGLYADVREAILGLRTSPHLEGGLIENISGYLQAFEQISGLRTTLQVDAGAELLTLGSGEEIQVMRLVQEALSNVRKHARASNVAVRFQPGPDGFRVLVEDDGCGFDPEGIPARGWPRFGLQTMRERADAIGGRFRVHSRPGHGTTIVVEIQAERFRRGRANDRVHGALAVPAEVT